MTDRRLSLFFFLSLVEIIRVKVCGSVLSLQSKPESTNISCFQVWSVRWDLIGGVEQPERRGEGTDCWPGCRPCRNILMKTDGSATEMNVGTFTCSWSFFLKLFAGLSLTDERWLPVSSCSELKTIQRFSFTQRPVLSGLTETCFHWLKIFFFILFIQCVIYYKWKWAAD